MHEFTITWHLFNQILTAARQANARRVLRVKLLIGEHSSIVPESVKFYFDQLRAEPLIQHTELEFTRVPLRLRCPKCGQEFSELEEACSCNAGAEIIGGDELLIESIDIE
jgi:hydrogenase nickel incorporation protein HypA/HybF|uniref:Hydrogenase maturation factor HypA n=1 Tax=candidate division WOR-3 bacterium TaxID=2052148 RepID=A0A7V3PUH5_UNCW3